MARVYVSSGNGEVIVNGKDYKEYFPLEYIQYNIEHPLTLTENTKTFTIKVNVSGGGIKGQAEAIRLGITRALVQYNEEYHGVLKEQKYLTRDSRVVERKKFGKPKARKSFQFSKR